MRIHTFVLAPLAVGLVCASLSACGSSKPSPAAAAHVHPTVTSTLGTAHQQAAMTALYKSAVKAGQTSLVIYGPGASGDQPYFKAFQKEFPAIHTTSQTLAGPQLTARLNAESASGKHVGDYVVDGDTPAWQLSLSGACAATSPLYPVPARWRQLGNTAFDDSLSMFGVVYNTSKLKASQVPDTWQQLLQPQWKGKVAVGDPAQGGVSVYTFATMLNKYQSGTYGMSYLRKLAASNLQLTDEPQVSSEVANGQHPLGILVWTGFYSTVKAKGAPLGFKLLKAQNQWTGNANCVLKHAPAPDAAKLYLNWLYSPQAQTFDTTQGNYGVMPGAPAPKGLGLPPLKDISLLKMLPPKQDVSAFNALQSQVVKVFR